MATDDQIQAFLKRMAQIESSNRYNVQHEKVNSKLHQGDRAIGKYGLMPLTIDEINRGMVAENPSINPLDPAQHMPLQLLPNIGRGESLTHPNAQYMANQMQDDPQMQDKFAQHFAKTLLNKPGMDDERAAAMWQFGQNLDKKPKAMISGRLSPAKLNNPDSGMGERVQKYRALVQKENPGFPQLIEESRKILPNGIVEKHIAASEPAALPERGLASEVGPEDSGLAGMMGKAREKALMALRDDDE